MAVKIRLRRMGAKKNPFYRVIVADSRTARNGRFIEEIGYYNPVEEPKVIKIDGERALDWISKGAKPTDTVDRLFRETGVYSQTEEQEETTEEETENADVESESEEPTEEA